MIITQDQKPTVAKCDRCKKSFTIKPFGYQYAPMCNKCRTFQTLCDECAKLGCIKCGSNLGSIIY